MWKLWRRESLKYCREVASRYQVIGAMVKFEGVVLPSDWSFAFLHRSSPTLMHGVFPAFPQDHIVVGHTTNTETHGKGAGNFPFNG